MLARGRDRGRAGRPLPRCGRIATVDEAISLLTGREAGARRRDGTFGPSTVHRLVDDRLRAYAEGMREFAAHARIAEGRGE